MILIYTLHEFLSLECIFNPKVMTSSGSVHTTVIEYISVIEIPVDNFIRKKELVLSTALGCYENQDLFLEFVKEIFDSQAAALVISEKSDSYYLPQNVIDFAEKNGFPIVMIPWECRFSEIMEDVITRLKHENLAKIKHFEAMQKELLHHFLNAASLADAGRIISRFLKCSVAITDKNYISKEAGPDMGGASQTVTIVNPEDYLQKLTIQGNGKVYGYLLLNFLDEPKKNITELESIEKYLLMPLLLWFNKEDIISVTKESLKNDFVWDLAEGRYKTREEISLKGALFGFNMSIPYTCIVCSIRSPDSDAADPVKDPDFSKNKEAVENTIWSLGKRAGRRLMFTVHQNIVVIYLENTPHDAEKNIFSFIDLLEEKLKALFPAYCPYWGISEINLSPADFHKYYQNASFALNICINAYSQSRRATYDDTNIFKMLSVLSKEPESKGIALSVLKPLLEHDADNRLTLLSTLVTYFDHNYNVCKTARTLHLHRQSLLYRLKKIEELTGMSLENHNELFLLELCARLHLSSSKSFAPLTAI